MYDNEMYGNSDNPRPTMGNFSGANTADFDNSNTVDIGDSNAVDIDNSNAGYFNHMDHPMETPKSGDVHSDRADSIDRSDVTDRHESVGMEASTDRTANIGMTASTDRAANIGMTSSDDRAANIGMTAPADRATYMNRTASPAQNTTWTQAPVRKMEEQDKASKTGEKKLGLMQKIMLSISMGLLFGIFAGIGFYGVKQAQNSIQSNNSQAVTELEQKNTVNSGVEANEAPQLQQASSSVVYTNGGTNVPGIVKDVMPAMVSIVNYYTERVSSFWGQTYEEEVPASGSGIIVSRTETELLIVTNNHVVEDANRLVVTLIDGTEIQAKVKGTDSDMDLAVIAISLNDLSDETINAITVATLGDSDNLELGEQVIAIGNALGYGQSVTVGYVSALDRELDMEDGTVGTYIQTDAAINGGNSGGALLNAAGEVIGINSAKIGGYAVEGMGYAIPITAASPIIADLMERQTRNKVAAADMGYMGIEPQDVTDQAAQLYGMPKGVYVVSVAVGSGAEAAGMVRGDVLTKFDGNKISSYADLQDVLQYYEIGDTVKVTVMRPEFGEYVSHELTLTLGARPTSNMFKK